MFCVGENALSICAPKRRDDVMTYLDRVEETEGAALGVVEEVLPLAHGLETVHQTAVVAVRRGRDEASGGEV